MKIKFTNILIFGSKIFFSLFFMKALLCSSLFASNGEEMAIQIAGKVTSASDNMALPGVTVLLKGTSTGTVTDIDGNYSITILNEDDILLFSFIGYKTQEIPVSGRSVINVVLTEDVQSLEELVVVGYGEQKRADVTGAIGSVDSETIQRTALASPVGAIQGRVAGVNVYNSNNKPGSGFNINIRGLSSINGSNSPLFVINGIPGADINAINPADIEKIDVLKDASATAIYGSRGANGVVIVTTKKGSSNKMRIGYDGFVGVRTATNVPEFMGLNEFVQYRREAFRDPNTGEYRPDSEIFGADELENIENGIYTDWLALMYEPGIVTNHNISLSGGNESTQYFMSLGYWNEKGNIAPQEYDRYTLNLSLSHEASEKVSMGGTIIAAHYLTNQGSRDAPIDLLRQRPTVDPYDAEGNLKFWATEIDNNSIPNPLFTQDEEQNEDKGYSVMGNVFLEFRPLEALSLRSTFSPKFDFGREAYFRGTYSRANKGSRLPYAQADQGTEFGYVWDNILTFDKAIQNHQLKVQVIQSIQQNKAESYFIKSRDLPFYSKWYNLGSGAEIESINSGYEKWSLSSFMGRINYQFNEKYLLTMTGRFDGSSRLAEGNKWGFFPSAAIAWRLENEDFIKNIGAINILKLRVSYGFTGNDNVDPYETSATVGQTLYDFGGEGAYGFQPNVLANKNLGWERTKEWNVGLDFGFWNSRLTGAVEVYNRLTTDLIMPKKIPAHSGFTSVVDNVGSTRNKGFEISLNSINIEKDDFSWSTNLTLARNNNEIVELYGGKEDDIANGWFIEEPIDVNYTYITDGVWQLNEVAEAAEFGQKPGEWKVKDISGPDGVPDGAISADYDRRIIGSPIPKWNGGLTNSIQYKNFDFSVFAYAIAGLQTRNAFYVYFTGEGATSNLNNLSVNYWTPENPSNDFARPRHMGPYRNNSSYIYQDPSFIKIGNITLGYTLPNNLISKLGLMHVRIYGTARNPFVFTDYVNLDPEIPLSGGGNDGPMNKTFMLGVNLSL